MTKRIFSKIFQIISTPTKSVEGAAAILVLSILLSRVLGLIRYRLLAAEFGNQIVVLDSFLAAAQVPEIIFEVLIFSAITVAFIPVFSSLLAKNQAEKAWKLARNLVTIGLAFFLILAIILFLVASKIAFLVAPGLVSENPEIANLIGNLIRVMVVAQLFFFLGIFSTSILQSYQHFLIPAIAPAVYNFGIILGIVFLSAKFGIFGPALGMVAGAVAFFAIQQITMVRLGSMFGFKFNPRDSNITKVAALAAPRIIGLAAARGIDWINIALASLSGAGAIVAFNFAQVLAGVPVGLFGASVAQAALPTLSSQFAKGELTDFKNTIISSIHQIFFLTLPAISLLSILRIPAIRLVFGAANFPWETTILAGRVLIILVVGISAQATLLLLVRAFYALEDAKTPIITGLAAFFLNVILATIFILLLHLPITYLAAAFSFSSIFYAATLIYFLAKKVNGLNWEVLAIPAVKMLSAAIFSALLIYFSFKVLDTVLDTSRTLNVLILTAASALIGVISYFVFNLMFGVQQAQMIHNFFARLKFPKKILTSETFKA